MRETYKFTLDLAAEYNESHHPPPSFPFGSEDTAASSLIFTTSSGCLQWIIPIIVKLCFNIIGY